MYIRLEAISLEIDLMINERIVILHFVQEMYSIEEASGMAIVPFRKPILFFAVRDKIIALDQI